MWGLGLPVALCPQPRVLEESDKVSALTICMGEKFGSQLRLCRGDSMCVHKVGTCGLMVQTSHLHWYFGLLSPSFHIVIDLHWLFPPYRTKPLLLRLARKLPTSQFLSTFPAFSPTLRTSQG